MSGVIGPHEARELDLLLAGSKPIAHFTRAEGEDFSHDTVAFAAALSSNKICMLTCASGGFERVYYFLNGEEWRAKVLELVVWVNPLTFTEHDLHRLNGNLVGYSKADIDHFLCGKIDHPVRWVEQS